MIGRVAWASTLTLAGCVYTLPPLSPRVRDLPARISEAGLYADASLTAIDADCMPYAPSFELWSDGATKRRWIRLPAGARIDTHDMDAWELPVGTELWKEFSVDGRRIETRLMTRVADGEDGWVGVAYAWSADQSEALRAIDGVSNALGTMHDVPEARACMTCHGGRASVALGFSAIQLSHAAGPGEATLDSLAASGLLSAPPAAPLVVPGTPDEVAALGYLHANCGSCHNRDRPEDHDHFRPPRDLDLWLTADTLASVRDTPTYRTAIDRFVVPGAPERSPLLARVHGGELFRRRMPPIATERIDVQGEQILERWIDGIGAP
jgi:hypothetical protein